ncbi:MAG: ribonuclease HI [Spirochaetaceae bacterium]|nr:MAG: ribonuclease HI [Spirochaetaceae bacterium]
MKIRIYTDGGCSGNPGPGAWAYILLQPGGNFQDARFVPETTNNRMELQAVIEALHKVRDNPELGSTEIELFTDSQYVKNGIAEWIHTWIRNGWKTRTKKPVKNQDLWKELLDLSSTLKVRWRWLQGHAGDRYNEACDRLVRETIKQGRV